MCGIVCYLGKNRAKSLILTGLKKLEYRGYDSWGYVVFDGKKTVLKKKIGKITDERVDDLDNDIEGYLGLGHTRWATHGGVSEVNAHPHFDCRQEIFVVHNGIIENYKILKEKLEKLGHKFNSQTDTEVIAHLLEEYKKSLKNFEAALFTVLNEIRGSFALGIFDKTLPDQLVGVRLASPLILGLGKDEFILASDPVPISLIGNDFVSLDDREVAIIKKDTFKIKSFSNQNKVFTPQKIDWQVDDITKSGFEHFMLKEIFEIPEAINNTLRGRIVQSGEVKLGGIEGISLQLDRAEKVVLTACGTAYYASLIGKYIFEELTDLDVDAEIASELRYRNYKFDEKTILIAVSQSGETADTLEAIKEAKRKNSITLGIVNVPGSTIARSVSAGVFTYAGPEVAVASTKAYYSQIVALILLAIFFGLRRKLKLFQTKEIIDELKQIPEKAKEVLLLENKLFNLAKSLQNYKNFFYLGRKLSYPVALEGALKLKEIAYVHAEGYAGGEMKHGPLALVEDEFPVFFINPRDDLYYKSLSNIEEVKARHGRVLLVTDSDNAEVKNDNIYVPSTHPLLTPLLTTIPLHLLAYQIAKLLGRDIDRPRNLAKSVTVE